MNSCGWERRLDIGPVVMDPEHLPVSILCVLTESRAIAGSHAALHGTAHVWVCRGACGGLHVGLPLCACAHGRPHGCAEVQNQGV